MNTLLKVIICFSLLFLPVTSYSGVLTDTKEKQMMAPSVAVFNLTERSSGSGTIVGKKGEYYVVLTAAHVACDPEVEFSIGFTPDKDLIEAKVIKCDIEHDLSLLIVKETSGLQIAKVCTTSAIRFDEVYSVGAGLRFPIFPTFGIVGNDNMFLGRDTSTRLIQHSASIVLGNSGGALYTKELGGYCLTGVNVSVFGIEAAEGSSMPYPGFYFAVHLSHIIEFLKDF